MPAKNNQEKPEEINDQTQPLEQTKVGQLMEGYLNLYLIVDTMNNCIEKLSRLGETETTLERLGVARQLVINELQIIGEQNIQVPPPPPNLPESQDQIPEGSKENPTQEDFVSKIE